MDLSDTLIKTIAGIRFEDIPAQAVDATKRIVLDTLGATLAGTSSPLAKIILDQVKEWGGSRESTVIVYGDKVPSPNAALANSCFARVREIDDIYERAPTHASGVIVPTSFAVAELRGKVNGKELITALTLGTDLSCRMARSCKASPARRVWDLTAAMTTFGAAIVAARILGLDEKTMSSAVAIAYSQVGGSDQGITEGREVPTWFLQHALAGKAGIVSALFAQKGFVGANDPIGRYYRTYENDEYDPAALTNEFGERFEGVDISIKPYPCSRTHHGSIRAALSLVSENDIEPRDISEISVLVNEMTYKASCEPLEIKQNPLTGFDAQFSLPYSVATAVVRKRALFDDYTDEAIKDSLVLEIVRKVKPMINPECKSAVGRPAVVMEIKTKDGKTYSKREDYVFGNPRNPMSVEEQHEKFRYCAGYAAKPLPKRNIEEAIELVSKLEDADDVSRVVKLLTA